MSNEPAQPDPTILTTQQIQREINSLKELTAAQQHGADEVVEQKFSAIRQQLVLVNDMRVEQKKDMKDALDAALAAQKEAVFQQNTAFGLATAKSETSMSEQMKQINVTFGTAIDGVITTLNDLKDRVSRLDSMRLGGEGADNTRRMDNGLLIAACSLLLSLVMGAVIVFRGA